MTKINKSPLQIRHNYAIVISSFYHHLQFIYGYEMKHIIIRQILIRVVQKSQEVAKSEQVTNKE
jgi:hypothetical protein